MTSTDATTTRRRGRGRGVLVSEYSRTQRINQPERRPGVTLPPPIPESALYLRLARDLSAAGYTCWRDVSFLGSWIDLYGRRSDGSTIAVELKVVHWSSAFRQAIRLRNAATDVYIGIWAPYVHRALTAAARERLGAAGIGVFSINGHTVVKLEAVLGPARHAKHVLLPTRATHRAK